MNNTYIRKDSDSFIFTDTYKTKELLWTYYNGFLDNLGICVQHWYFNRNNKIYFSGVVRYGFLFYGEIRGFFDDVKGLDRESIDRINFIFGSYNDDITKDDLLFARGFFQDFMILSGIKNIVVYKDNKSALARSQEF